MTNDMLIKELRPSRNTKHYDAIHWWLRSRFGRPRICEGTNCTKKSKIFEWALKPSCKYEKKRSSFLRLCSSCHYKMDIMQKPKWYRRMIMQKAVEISIKVRLEAKVCKNGHVYSIEGVKIITLKGGLKHRRCNRCLKNGYNRYHRRLKNVKEITI